MKPILSLKRSAYCAFAAMIVLLILAAIYYKERMIFTDAAVIAFRRINLHDLESSQRRYGAYITELVPWTLSYVHLPLKYVEFAYSLSFNLFYLVVMYLLVFRWKTYSLAILMASYYLLFASASYYWTNNEIHQAIAYLFLCLGWSSALARGSANRNYQVVVFSVTAALAIFTHPICIVAIIFLWVFLLLTSGQWPYQRKQTITYSIIILLIIIIKLSLSTKQSYDSWKMAGIMHLGPADLLTVWNSPVAKAFYRACLTNYWSGILLCIAGLAAMIYRRGYMPAFWAIGSALGFLALLGITFPVGNFPYVLEAEWQTFGIIALAPATYYLLPYLSARLATGVICLMLITRLVYVISAGSIFTHRLAYIDSMLHKMREKGLTKVIIKARDGVPEGELFYDWGLATESTILSALEGDYPQRTVCSLWPDQQARIPTSNYDMVWNFDNRPVSVLNPHYFAIDTTRLYIQLSYEDLMR